MSLPLALIALVLSTVIAIPVGIFAAARRGTRRRYGVMGGDAARRRHPEFLVRAAADLRLRRLAALVPAGGFPGWGAGFWPALKALILPAIALALPQAAILAARHALGAARRAGRGLHPHRPRQGPAARDRCCGATRCATR